MGQLNAGVSNLLDKNSLFSTAVNLDNTRVGDLGGLGGVMDTLNKAKNLTSFKELPGTIGDSVFQATQNILEGGETIDAALVAADVIYPGSGSIVKAAFGNQIKGQRGGGGSCETGPTSNGPPMVKIFGGNGNGATANPVIGPNGNLLAVQITRGGKGFTDVPYVVITDSSGNGKGAVVKAQVGAGGTLTDISVVHAGYGYTGAPDGGVGGNGMNFANADNTMLKDKEGNYYNFEPGTGIVIPPGGIVYLPVGSKAQLPTSTVKTNGEPLVAPSGSNIINYAAIRLMHDFDTSKGKIIPGKQGAEGVGKPGFGKGIDYKRAKEEGYSDSDIRFFLEGDKARGQKSAGVSGYFVNHMNGAIGQNMQKLLDDPKWGQLPIMNSAGKNPGKIKSLQIQWKKGYKGFAKVTDGSRLGAGPVTGLRDAVTDRKISNILEFQTGNWLNVQADLNGNTDIMELFKQAELRSIEGTEIEGYGKFGTAGKRTWEQTRQSVASGFESNISGGGQRKNILGENYRTLDPWRADLKAGTRLTFRGVYNHNTGLSTEQLQDPYNLQKNNYRYFVYDWVVEVYDTPFSYSYAQGVDTVKNKWYKLVDIKLVTATEDWFNGETVMKRCRDKAGRLYEMYIKICTYDDSTAEAIGYGLATSSEGQQVIKTPLPCNPPKKSDKWADYQPVRWWREMQGEKKMVSEAYGHIPGTERNTLVREIVEVYNEIGNKNKIRFTDYHNAVPYKKARQYVDQEGLNHWVKEYFIQLELVRKGLSSELEEGTESKPLSEAEYTSYKDNLNQKPEPTAFASMKKLIWAGFKEAARKQGPIVKEETYCDWAREYVDEVQDTFRPTTTIGYELPCGGEITAP